QLPGSSVSRTISPMAQSKPPRPAASAAAASLASPPVAAPSPPLDAATRLKVILAAPETERRERFARHLAYSTALPADEAIAALAVSGYERGADDPIPLAGATDPLAEL